MLDSPQLTKFKQDLNLFSVVELQNILALVHSKLSETEQAKILTRLNNQKLKGIPFELVEDEDILEMGL